MTTGSRRIERLNDLLREEISQLIVRELKDPRVVGMVSVTEVIVSPDLRHARVHVSVLGTESERLATMTALSRAAGFFRRELSGRLALRRMPELEIILDQSLERGDHMLRLIKQVAGEQTAQDQPHDKPPLEPQPE